MNIRRKELKEIFKAIRKKLNSVRLQFKFPEEDEFNL